MRSDPSPNTCDVSLGEDGAAINGAAVHAAEPVENFYSMLGKPNRVEALGEPAPVGHRNSYAHFYDNLGVTLSEHHYTYLIIQVSFILNAEEAIHPSTQAFKGRLSVGGVLLSPGDAECILADSTIRFTSQLAGTWFATISASPKNDRPLSVSVHTKGRKLRSGRRSKRREVLSVHLGLEHDPWDNRFRPE